MTEIQLKNLLGEIKYICVNTNTENELLRDFNEEFETEYEDMGRKPNRADLREYLGMKILIDDHLIDHRYKLLSQAK